MEVSVLQENLNRVLGKTRPFTSPKGYLPASKMVRLTAAEGRLTVEANDLEKAIKVQIGAQVQMDGAICVDAGRLKAFVGTLADERIDLRSKNSDQPLALVIESGDSDATMAGLESGEFPPVTEIEDPVVAVFDPAELEKALTRALTSVAREDSRPVLNGAHIELGPNGYVLAAADGFRLVKQVGPLVTAPEDEVEAIIPRGTLEAIKTLVKGEEDSVRVEFEKTGKRFRFTVGGCEVVGQGVLGSFPDFDQLIPKEGDMSWTVTASVEALANAVKSAAVYASEASGIIRFAAEAEGEDASDVTVRVSATAEAVGDAMREVVGANTVGVDQGDKLSGKIAFHSGYVHDLLAVLDGRVRFGATTPSSPSLWQLIGDETFVCVLMPMFVSW